MNTNRSAPAAALVALVLVWGYSWVAMKIGLRHAHPFDFAALRVGIGALLLFALVAARRKPLRSRATAWPCCSAPCRSRSS